MARSHNRFVGLLKSLGVALLNATLVLVIVAAISVGWAAYSVREMAVDTARNVTIAAIEAANLDPRTVISELRSLESEIEALRINVQEGQNDGAALRALQARLNKLERQIDLLTNPQDWSVSDSVIDRMTESLGRILKEWRNCNPTSAARI